jgi:enoyl-CoA hydratase
MAYKTVILAKEKGIATITLNRPEVLNAINSQLRHDLRAAVEEVRKDKEIRVLLITGAGDKAFSAGRDLKEYSEYKTPPIEDWGRRLNEGASFGLTEMPKPVIAVINGYAVAGGLELALACDIRIASEKATFGFFEIRRGFFPGGGATWRLAPLVGEGWAMELILGGDTVTAQVAERIGLVNRVVPHENLMNTARELAQNIASKSLPALMLAKMAIKQSMEAYERTGSNICVALRALAETNEDKSEGTKAFVEKREATFKK